MLWKQIKWKADPSPFCIGNHAWLFRQHDFKWQIAKMMRVYTISLHFQTRAKSDGEIKIRLLNLGEMPLYRAQHVGPVLINGR